MFACVYCSTCLSLCVCLNASLCLSLPISVCLSLCFPSSSSSSFSSYLFFYDNNIILTKPITFEVISSSTSIFPHVFIEHCLQMNTLPRYVSLETGSHTIAKAGLESMQLSWSQTHRSLFLRPPKFWDITDIHLFAEPCLDLGMGSHLVPLPK